jgi:hypothetical protein
MEMCFHGTFAYFQDIFPPQMGDANFTALLISSYGREFYFSTNTNA